MANDLLKKMVYVDAFEPIPLVDSFVKFNKVGSGKGEARLYLGSENKESIHYCPLKSINNSLKHA